MPEEIEETEKTMKQEGIFGPGAQGFLFLLT
jgi:hypothetical protein